MRKSRLTSVLGLFAWSFTFLWGGALAQEGVSEAEVRSRVDALVEDLAAADFAVRERATAELMAIGAPALGPLSGMSASTRFEARHRAAIIRQRIEDQVFEKLSRSFLLDLDASNSYGLPGWQAFRGLVGTTRTSKLLFLETLRQDQGLVELVAEVDRQNRDGAKDAVAIQLRTELASMAAMRAEAMQNRLYELRMPAIGESVGLLFAAAVLEQPTPVEVSEVICGMTQLSFDGYLRKQGYQDCLRSLLSAWLPKTHAAMAPEAMQIALSWDLAVVIPIAREHLSENFDVSTREAALQCLAKFGDAVDVPALWRYLEDVSVIEKFAEVAGGITTEFDVAPPGVPALPRTDPPSPEEVQHVVRVNDLAAATAMLLLDEDPRVVFPNYEPNPQNLINTHELAVSESDAPKQTARIKAWAAQHQVRQSEG